MDDIMRSLRAIHDRLENIENEIKLLNRDINLHVKPETAKMSNHIDFIELVYSRVKAPLNYICAKLSRSNIAHSPLPAPTKSSEGI